MKKCPVCQTKFKDTTTKCRYCNELLVTVPPPKQKTLVKYPRKRKRKTFFSKWQVTLQKIFSKYWYWAYIITIVIAILIVGFQLVSKNLDLNKKSDQLTNIKPPNAEINTLPGTGEADKLVQNPSTVSKTPDSRNSVWDWNNMAVTLWDNGKYTDPNQAIEYLNNALKQQPNYAQTYYNRGLAYYNLGQYQKAVEDYDEAIRLKPDYPHAYYNRGTAYFNLGNNSLACSDFQKACELGRCDQLEKSKENKLCH